jgi:putative Mg2+ transporter-C (MgtC) family protein
MLPHAETLLRLLVAAVFGSLIGFERERLLWAAGIRTHMLVCVGACLFMIVSAYGFSPVLAPNVVLDPSRVPHGSFLELAFWVPARSWRAVKSLKD